MAIIKAFKGYRPQKGLEKQIAAKPYDVLNSEEARFEKGDNQYSFYTNLAFPVGGYIRPIY